MTEQSNNDKFSFRIHYPWRTLLAVILLLFYALLLLTPALAETLNIPQRMLHPLYFLCGFIAFLLLAWFDVKRFFYQQKRVRESMHQLWSSKRHLQERAQTSASHTDKLKLFISDKLLEYIEYDEKYLHFKSIASEVRHNGVISFDKVQSALTYAQGHSLPDESGTGANARMYQEALSGMRYLWDLLDLSTTDNMALHIGAYVSRCEELLFEAELQGQDASSMPVAPAFDPRQALIDTLILHLGVTLCDEQGNPDPQVLFSLNSKAENPAQSDEPSAVILTDTDGLYRIEIQPCESLLGNANHLILLLENLIKNAQFFATKRKYKSPFAPISVRLWEARQCLCMTIYNRGPHIDYETKDQIFKLGFSTRRVQEHHGKGLGLYFAQQITQGKQNRTFVVILSPVVQVPTELEKQIVVIEHELPGREQLEELARSIATEEGELPEDDLLNTVLDAASGLTRYEAEAAFSLSLVREQAVHPQAIWELKCQMLKKSGLLALHRGSESFGDLGGLNALKSFCAQALRSQRHGNPLKRPRGALLLGVPGTGKSAFAKALGNETNRPTLSLDIGALMGSLVGQSESNIRQALKIADAMAPCVLFLDECEKALAGAASSGQTDSGVSARLFGSFLSWLNDHQSDVFVIATCNDISKLPPEFSRAERFDGVFFLDLPSATQKGQIWNLCLSLFDLDPEQPKPKTLEWTGAEIRSCCRLAALLDVPLMEAAKNVVPVAVTAAESVQRLRDWARGRCLDADEPGLYSPSRNTSTKSRRSISRDPSLN
ncbi:MAG: hypothetical protein CMF17_10140 [Idiomarinaceae bacterium]|nr:hypothetical protein [Idiomarinaceae bacterium]